MCDVYVDDDDDDVQGCAGLIKGVGEERGWEGGTVCDGPLYFFHRFEYSLPHFCHLVVFDKFIRRSHAIANAANCDWAEKKRREGGEVEGSVH